MQKLGAYGGKKTLEKYAKKGILVSDLIFAILNSRNDCVGIRNGDRLVFKPRQS